MIIRRLLTSLALLTLCGPVQAQHEGVFVAALAKYYLGAPYRFGGTGPDGFDCSGLVHHIHRLLGRDIPRTAHAQFLAARPVGLDQLRAGDLLFFRVRERPHVGIYVGDGRFIHAPSRGRTVRYDELGNPFWRARMHGAGRLVSAE
ncbi:MAG: C40 family peptidase [Thiohalomonadaceae bacterium]